MLLFPSEHARVLSTALLAEDRRPLTLVVPDGNWRQASRIRKRVRGLAQAEPVVLPRTTASRWGVRREPNAAGLATFEAIARAIGIAESAAAQAQLEAFFDRVVAATHAAAGRMHRGRATPPSALNGAPRDAAAVAPAAPLAATSPPLSILYADDHLLAINKPSGAIVHRGWCDDATPLLQRVRDHIGRFVYPVHRLDRGTSGVLLFALSSEVARDLQLQFEAQRVDKRYLALCRGHDLKLTRIDHPIVSERNGSRRPAITDFRWLGTFERYGLFEAFPQHGRTHQIRRHLKHAAHPIIGDVRYGKGEHNRIFRQRFGFHRLALHCERISLRHPRTAQTLVIRAPLRDGLAELLEQLGLLAQAAAVTPARP